MPDKFGLFSIKETIAEANLNGIKPIYVLIGNDAYLQTLFINQIKKIFSEESVPKNVYSFDEDDGDAILNEITGISLFAESKLFILRGIKKMKKSHLADLISWNSLPNPNNCVVLIKNEFDLKNSIMKELKSNFMFIDVRTPFPNKIRDWVNYILKIKNISLAKNSIETIIENCGDSIANIENEIEKIILSEEFTEDSIAMDGMKDYPIWELSDAIGKRDMQNSFKIYNNLWRNNISLSQIIFNLNNLFQGILWQHLGEKNNQFGLNYFIQKNISYYTNNYNLSEVKKVISDIRMLDFKLKSSSVKEKEIMIPFLVKTCKGVNESV